MSWEVRDMKSRTSFYNAGVGKNLLRRFWPVWAAYLVLLLVSFVFQLPQQLAEAARTASPYGRTSFEVLVLQNAADQVRILVFAAVLSAMAAYSYLYTNRACGMMNALPIRRETMFGTAFLTGLVPLLLAQVLAVGLTALTCLEYKLPFVYLLRWLGLVVMATVAFYGFAVFCAVLTGNILVLPAVYAVLNMTAVVAETCVRMVLGAMRYGYADVGIRLGALSPIAFVMRRGFNVYTGADGRAVVTGAGTLGAYCAAGLVLAALALLIYRRRHMECATDVVAVPILKPVFQYCMAFGTAFVFPVVIGEMLNVDLRGLPLTLLLLLLILLGAFLGWYIAEMLMQKSLKVFFRNWKGLALVCAVLLLIVGATEFDLFGYERRVPAPDTVESVSLNRCELQEPENVAAAVALHQTLVDHKRLYDGESNGYGVSIEYILKDGKRLIRNYVLPCDPTGKIALNGDLQSFQDLTNSQEAIRWRVTPQLPVEEQYVSDAQLYYSYMNEDGYLVDGHVRISPEQAVDLYQNGILPDAAEGTVALNYVTDGQPGSLTLSNIHFNMNLEEDPLTPRYDLDHYMYDYLWFNLYLESAHTMQWLRENTTLAEMICSEAELIAAEQQARGTAVPGA